MTPPITLRPMRPDEYEAYAAARDAEYVASLDRELPPEAARAKARDDRAKHLPDGVATPRHRLVVAESAAGEAVGVAWLGLDEPRTGSSEVAWLYDILVHPEHRGSGYGRALLAAVEDLAREAGALRLGLNVFGDNDAAIALYAASGYFVTAQQMAKDLGSP